MKLHLRGIQLALVGQLAPFGEGEHLVAVIILQRIRVKTLQVADVGVLALPQRAHEVVLFIKPIRVAEHFIARRQVLGIHILAKERAAIGELVRLETGEVQNRWPKVDEAHEAIRACATLVIHKVRKIFRNPHHQRHVQTALVRVPLAARQHAAVIAKVKDERILEQTIVRQTFHHIAEQTVDDLDAVEIPRVRVAKHRRVRMIRREFHLGRIVFGLFVLKHLLGKMQRTLVRLADGLHVKEGLPVRAFAPTRVARGFVPQLFHVVYEIVIRLGVVRRVIARLT